MSIASLVRRPQTLLAAAGALALVAGIALAATQDGDSHAARTPAPDAAAAASSGMRVAVQPESGEFETPSPEQAKALVAGPLADNYRTDDLVVQTLPDGSMRVNLKGRFLNYSVATVAPDGKIHHSCTTDPCAAQAHLATPAPRTDEHGLEVE